jgi:hypothetical protein
MKDKQKRPQEQEPDPHLDTPSEANREKHINFRDIEEESEDVVNFQNKDEVKKRREQWQQGIEEGKKECRGDTGND